MHSGLPRPQEINEKGTFSFISWSMAFQEKFRTLSFVADLSTQVFTFLWSVRANTFLDGSFEVGAIHHCVCQSFKIAASCQPFSKLMKLLWQISGFPPRFVRNSSLQKRKTACLHWLIVWSRETDMNFNTKYLHITWTFPLHSPSEIKFSTKGFWTIATTTGTSSTGCISDGRVTSKGFPLLPKCRLLKALESSSVAGWGVFAGSRNIWWDGYIWRNSMLYPIQGTEFLLQRKTKDCCMLSKLFKPFYIPEVTIANDRYSRIRLIEYQGVKCPNSCIFSGVNRPRFCLSLFSCENRFEWNHLLDIQNLWPIL